jgi:hypothetical protein
MITGTLSRINESDLFQNFLEGNKYQMQMADANISRIFNPKQTVTVKSRSDLILEEIYGI